MAADYAAGDVHVNVGLEDNFYKPTYLKCDSEIFKSLSPKALKIYLAMWRRADWNKEQSIVRISIPEIGRQCDMSRPTVFKYMDEIFELGVLRKEERRSCYEPNSYSITQNIGLFSPKPSLNTPQENDLFYQHCANDEHLDEDDFEELDDLRSKKSLLQSSNNFTTVVKKLYHSSKKSLPISIPLSLPSSKPLSYFFSDAPKIEPITFGQAYFEKINQIPDNGENTSNLNNMDVLQAVDIISDSITKSDYQNNRTICKEINQSTTDKPIKQTADNLEIDDYVQIYNSLATPFGCPVILKNKRTLQDIKRSLKQLKNELKNDYQINLTPALFESFLHAAIERGWYLLCKYQQTLHVLLRPKNFIDELQRQADKAPSCTARNCSLNNDSTDWIEGFSEDYFEGLL